MYICTMAEAPWHDNILNTVWYFLYIIGYQYHDSLFSSTSWNSHVWNPMVSLRVYFVNKPLHSAAPQLQHRWLLLARLLASSFLLVSYLPNTWSRSLTTYTWLNWIILNKVFNRVLMNMILQISNYNTVPDSFHIQPQRVPLPRPSQVDHIGNTSVEGESQVIPVQHVPLDVVHVTLAGYLR